MGWEGLPTSLRPGGTIPGSAHPPPPGSAPGSLRTAEGLGAQGSRPAVSLGASWWLGLWNLLSRKENTPWGGGFQSCLVLRDLLGTHPQLQVPKPHGLQESLWRGVLSNP